MRYYWHIYTTDGDEIVDYNCEDFHIDDRFFYGFSVKEIRKEDCIRRWFPKTEKEYTVILPIEKFKWALKIETPEDESI